MDRKDLSSLGLGALRFAGREPARPFLLLFGALLAFYFFPQLVGFPTWDTFGSEPTLNHKGVLPRGVSYAELFCTMRQVARARVREGRVPGWLDTQGLGLCLTDQYDYHLYNPLEWLCWLGGPRWWTFLLCLYLACGACGVYWFGRKHLAVEEGAALAGAFVYALAGAAIFSYDYFSVVHALVCLPLILYAAHALLTAETGRARSFLTLTAAVALLLLGGQPQIAFCSALGVGTYCGLLLLVVEGRAVKAVLLTAAGALAVVIAAPQTLSCIASQVRGASFSMHQLPLHGAVSLNVFKTPPLNLLNFFAPYLQGPLVPWFAHAGLRPGVWEDFQITFGFLGCALILTAFVGILGRRARRGDLPAGEARVVARVERSVALVFAAAVLFLVLQSLGTRDLWPFPFVNVFKYSPPVLALFGALLVSLGADFCRVLPRRLALLPACLLGGLLAAGMLYVRHHRAGLRILDPDLCGHALFLTATAAVLSAGAWLVLWSRRESPAVAWGLAILVGAEAHFLMRYGFRLEQEWWRAAVFALAVVCGVAMAYRRRVVAACAGAAAGLAFIVFMATAGPRVEVVQTWRDQVQPLYAFLAGKAAEGRARERVLGAARLIHPNLNSLAGFQTLANRNPLVPKELQAYLGCFLRPSVLGGCQRSVAMIQFEGMDPDPPRCASDLDRESPNRLTWAEYFRARPFFNLLGVRYLVDWKDGALEQTLRLRPGWGHDLRPVALPDKPWSASFVVLEDTRALPKAYFAGSYASVPFSTDGWGARQWMRANEKGLLARPVVELRDGQLPTFDGIARPLPEPGLPQPLQPASVWRYSSDEVVLRVTAPGPGVLVLNDQYDARWRALVNGEEGKVVRVNSVVRGVLIPGPGEYVVRLAFCPGTARLAGLSLLGIAAACGIAFVLSRKGRSGRGGAASLAESAVGPAAPGHAA